MGTDGCRRFPISRRYSKRSASSFILSLSVFPMASSTNSRIFLIWVTVRALHAKTQTMADTSNLVKVLIEILGTNILNPGDQSPDSHTDNVSAVRASRSCTSSGRDSSSPTGSFFCKTRVEEEGMDQCFKPGLEAECTVPSLFYLHFLPNAFAAEVLGFVETVCSEAACRGKHHSQSMVGRCRRACLWPDCCSNLRAL